MRRITLSEGEYYHIYNRGVDKRTIFTSETEYKRFVAYLYLLNGSSYVRPDVVLRGNSKNNFFSIKRGDPLIAIGAYCLMPNHFHILATPLIEGGIAKFMQRLQTAYTMYFNEKHKRSGSLLQGTYKAQHADKDNYLKYLYSYIHLNPAKLFDKEWKNRGVRDLKKLKQRIVTYQYSSINEYFSSEHNVTNSTHFPKYFETAADFDSQISFWLSNKDIESKPKKWKV